MVAICVVDAEGGGEEGGAGIKAKAPMTKAANRAFGEGATVKRWNSVATLSVSRAHSVAEDSCCYKSPAVIRLRLDIYD